MRKVLIPIVLVAFSGAAFAEDARTGRARRKIEQQLKDMVKPSPASVEIVFDGIDSTRYQLLEASFDLDGAPLPKKVPTGKSVGPTVLFGGDLSPGSHTVTAKLVYEQASAGMFSYGSGTKFKVPGKFIFTAQRGLLVRVHTRVEVDDGAELQKRLQLAGNVDVDLRAKLEDGTLPPAPESLVQKPAVVQKTKSPGRKSRVKPEPLSDSAAPSMKRNRSEGKVKFATAAANATAPVKEAAYVDGAAASAPNPTPTDAGAPASAGAESVDAGAAALDAGTTMLAESPPPPPTPTAQRASQGFTATDVGVGIGAIALVVVLVVALTRRRD